MNRLFRHTIAMISIGSMGFGATCSAGNAGNSASSPINACKLVSADRAGKILGTKITIHAMDSSAAGPNAASMCNYSGTSISGGFMLIAGHVGYKDAAAEVARQKKEEVSHVPPTLPKPSFSDIQGLGDATYLYKIPGSFQLHVLAYGDAIVINRNVAADPKVVDQAKQIARVALSNLK